MVDKEIAENSCHVGKNLSSRSCTHQTELFRFFKPFNKIYIRQKITYFQKWFKFLHFSIFLQNEFSFELYPDMSVLTQIYWYAHIQPPCRVKVLILIYEQGHACYSESSQIDRDWVITSLWLVFFRVTQDQLASFFYKKGIGKCS